MAGNHLSNDEFFTRLAALFDSRRTTAHGSVFLTQKRLHAFPFPKSESSTPPSYPSSFADLHPPQSLPVLIRATDGNDKKDRKVKLSTVVQADDLDKFFVKYMECWKAGMSGLKKRDRSGRKAKAKGKKRKGNEGDGGNAG